VGASSLPDGILARTSAPDFAVFACFPRYLRIAGDIDLVFMCRPGFRIRTRWMPRAQGRNRTDSHRPADLDLAYSPDHPLLSEDARAISPSKNRSRFLVNTVTSQTGSSMLAGRVPKGDPAKSRIGRLVGTYVERSAARRRDLEVALERFLRVCRTRPDVRAVYAFGSFALAQTGPRSDLDLLVVRETTVRGIERGTDLAIEADVGIALDLIVVTPAEYRERLPATSFGRTILSSARAVYAA